MKSSYSNMWLLGLVALFIFVFAGYLAVTISYSRAFKMKNEMLSIIERHNGMTADDGASVPSIVGKGNVTNPGALQTINLYLYGSAYKTSSQCPQDGKWYGVKDLVNGGKPAGTEAVEAVTNSSSKYYYCFSKWASAYGENDGGKNIYSYYYKVILFYRMDLPVVGDMFVFNVEGTTADIYFANEKNEVKKWEINK